LKRITFEMPIYTFQIDFAGVVSNIVYIQWMEMGRNKLLEATGFPVHQLVNDGIIPVLVSTEITYKKPLRLGDSARVEAWFSQIKGATARIEIRFYNGEGILVASGCHRGLFVDKNNRPLRVTRELRAAFSPYLGDE
jgi:acyl-CoA thioester hydrolase